MLWNSVVGIQETKWFGKDVWPAVEGFMFLHSVDLSWLAVKMQHIMKAWGFC